MFLRGTRPKFSPIKLRQLRPRISYSYRGFSFRDVWMLCLLLGIHSKVSFCCAIAKLKKWREFYKFKKIHFKSDESSTNWRFHIDILWSLSTFTICLCNPYSVLASRQRYFVESVHKKNLHERGACTGAIKKRLRKKNASGADFSRWWARWGMWAM